MQAPRNKVVCIFSTEVIPNIFTSCLRYKLLLEIQTILDAFSDGNKCTTLICLFTKKYVEQQSERMLFEEILFPPFGQAFYTKNILLNIELLTSVKD